MFGNLTFPVEAVELRPGDVIDRRDYAIRAFAVDHGAAGGRLPARRGDAARALRRRGRRRARGASGRERGALQRGEAITLASGETVLPEQVLGPARPGRTVALTGDTAPAASVVDAAAGVDLLVHEATFCADERQRARETRHSTAAEAALAAQAAGVHACWP